MSEKRVFSSLRRAWRNKPSWAVPLALFITTCVTTTFVGYITYSYGSMSRALWFSVPLMTILSAHELGHYLQLRRRGIPSTFPLFLPAPLPPLGTLGAIMRIRARIPDRRVLFEMAASGPVAGLVVSLIFLCVGLYKSSLSSTPPTDDMRFLTFGAPPVMRWLARLILVGETTGARFVLLHPCAIAAWVGLLLTSLNLIPVGQLDGGHIIYSLLRRRSTFFSYVALAIVCVVAAIFRFWGWFIFVALIAALGFKRVPTSDDTRPLGFCRAVAAWLVLAYLLVGFIPRPVYIDEPTPETDSVANIDVSERGPLVFHIGSGR